MEVKSLLFLIFSYVSHATYGVDLTTVPSIESLKCFKLSARRILIGRAWRSQGAFDTNIIQTLINAQEAGYSQDQVGVYMHPCYSEQRHPEVQAAEMMGNLTTSRYSSIWINLDMNFSPGCGWSKDFYWNCQYATNLYKKSLGIYASSYTWNQIMGGPQKCIVFSDMPLWYVHYDNQPNFYDFKPFGGWYKAHAKQYKSQAILCNTTLNLNLLE